MTTTSPGLPVSVTFGLEKLGLVSLRYPRAMLAIVMALAAILSIGTFRLDFTSDPREIFRSQAPGFAVMEEMAGNYPGTVDNVLLLVEGSNLFQLESLKRLQELYFDLQFADAVLSVDSMFAARRPPAPGEEEGDTVFPAELDSGTDLKALEQELLRHPFVSNKLLSGDGKLALFVISLDGKKRDLAAETAVIAPIREAVKAQLEGTGLTHELTGVSVMRTEIMASLRDDQAIFKSAGLAVGVLFSWLFFRKLRYVVITNLPVTVAMIFVLSGMWLLGQKINVLTNMVTPLIMVIALSDALHMVFGIRRNLAAGLALEQAIEKAVREVGPGCVLTSLTTTIALLSLTLAPYPLISRFGLTAAFGTLMAYVATMSVLPAAAVLILRRWPVTETASGGGDWLSSAIDRVCALAAGVVGARPRAMAAIGVLLTGIVATLYAMNVPHYTAKENLPASSATLRGIQKIDAKLAGMSNIELYLKWPEGRAFPTAESLDAIADAHAFLAAVPWINETWSLHTVVRWLEGSGLGQDDALRFLKANRDTFQNRMLTETPATTRVTGYFPDTNAAELVPLLRALEGRLDELRKRHPDVTIAFSGTTPLEATSSYDMIGTLNTSLLTAIALIIVLIGFALRSARAGCVSILPNIFPIACAGAYLYLSGAGFQFTAVIAFTVGFGIAVDSTIHYFNRYRLARAAGHGPAEAVSETTRSIGPILIVSTIILSCGMGVTILSALPMVDLFGRVSILVLFTALVGDILFLPALLQVVESWKLGAADQPAVEREGEQTPAG